MWWGFGEPALCPVGPYPIPSPKYRSRVWQVFPESRWFGPVTQVLCVLILPSVLQDHPCHSVPAPKVGPQGPQGSACSKS